MRSPKAFILALLQRLFLYLLLLAQSLSTAATEPQALSYRVLDQQAQDRSLFIQGLTFDEGHLYLATGGYGESKIQRISKATGQLLSEAELADRYFGEGIAILNGKLAQLTWRSGRGYLRDPDSLAVIKPFRVDGEGWGITASETEWIMSDGSSYLTFLDADTLQPSRKLPVTLNGKPVSRLNELEMIDGYVWANIWFDSKIVIIDPATGIVEAVLDLSNLLPRSERRSNTDVLNGIAFDKEENAVWFTGKRWPWRYKLEILPDRPKVSR
jgi:glutamine cyclotransferase